MKKNLSLMLLIPLLSCAVQATENTRAPTSVFPNESLGMSATASPVLSNPAALKSEAHDTRETFYPADVAVYFSPKGGAEDAVVHALDSARSDVRVQAYLFDNRAITQALIRAHRRGVNVVVLIDKKMLKRDRKSINALLENDVPTFFDGAHRTAHDKIIIVDEDTVITGSFNFVDAAETKNGENLLVLRSKPLNERYRANWNRHFAHRITEPVK